MIFDVMKLILFTLCFILFSVITIFFAVSLKSSGLKESFYWVMAIFVIVHLIFHFLFQLHAWTSGKKSNFYKLIIISYNILFLYNIYVNIYYVI